MHHPFPLWVGFRYTRSRRRSRSVSLITLISMVGLILGVAVLIAVLSVMNGFDRELRDRVLGVMPHGVIVGRAPIANWRELAGEFTLHPGVAAAAPFINGSALLVAGDRIHGVAFSGIDPELEASVSIIDDYFVSGSLGELANGRFGILMGAHLAGELGLEMGDSVTMVLPEATISVAGAMTRVKRFTLKGIFRVGSEVDREMVLIALADAGRLTKQREGAQGIRVRLHDLFAAPTVLQDLLATQERGAFGARSWMRQHGNIYRAIQMQKGTMFLLLLMVVAVAAFNVVSSLVMMVNDKRGEIAILRTLGASRGTVMAIFLFFGTLVGVLGVACGTLLGTLIAWSLSDLYLWFERTFGLDVMSEYFINYLPSEVRPDDLLSVTLLTLFICFLATIYPALRATATNPAEVLRYE